MTEVEARKMGKAGRGKRKKINSYKTKATEN